MCSDNKKIKIFTIIIIHVCWPGSMPCSVQLYPSKCQCYFLQLPVLGIELKVTDQPPLQYCGLNNLPKGSNCINIETVTGRVLSMNSG